jgi:hypothetical protein
MPPRTSIGPQPACRKEEDVPVQEAEAGEVLKVFDLPSGMV